MNLNNELKEAPLGYWEKKSYMSIIPKDNEIKIDNSMFERIANIPGVEIKQKNNLTDEELGKIIINYLGEEFEIGFYIEKFNLPEIYLMTSYYFPDEEIEDLKNAKTALTVFMKFGKNAKKSYYLQLKIACSLIPNFVGFVDESSEKIIPKKLIKMLVNSNVDPDPTLLYTVQAITGDNDEIWLHTHGLCRCGLTEIEILKSDKSNYNNHYNLLSTLAGYMIDNSDTFNPLEKSAYIGMLSNNDPIVVTCKSWTKALKEYNNLDLGGIEDRKNSHNSKTSVIFLYKSAEDEKNDVVSKVSDFNDKLGINPIFFISDKETERMKLLAREKFYLLKEQAKNKENKILIKIGICVNKENDDFEHIWFELVNFDENKFKARLTQEPYNISNMHVGDIKEYTVNDVTDWIIYTPKFSIKPTTSYIIE